MNKKWIYIRLAFFILIPIILLGLPAAYFDEGESICLSVMIFGKECYACGLTRGVMHLIHFDIAEAFYHNPFTFIAFPILAFLWAKWFLKDWKLLRSAPINS